MPSYLDNIDRDGLDDLANYEDFDDMSKANSDLKNCYSLHQLIDQEDESKDEKFLDKVAERDVFKLLKDLPPETVSGQKRIFEYNLALELSSEESNLLDDFVSPDASCTADKWRSREAERKADFCNEVQDLLTDSDFNVASNHTVDEILSNWNEHDIDGYLDSFGISNDISSFPEECRSSEHLININHPLKEMMSTQKECDVNAMIEEVKECKSDFPPTRSEVSMQEHKWQKIEMSHPLSSNGDEYRDLSRMPHEEVCTELKFTSMTGRSQEPFPVKLHKILEQSEIDGYSSIISWLAHGRAFKIHNTSLLFDELMPKYFYQTKLTSFHRRLKIYVFYKLQNSLGKGAYCHGFFLRGRPGLSAGILRQKSRRTVELKKEPNFYEMPSVDPNDFSSYNTLTSISHVNEPRTIRYITNEGEKSVEAVKTELLPQLDPVLSARIAQTPFPVLVPVSSIVKSLEPQKRLINVATNGPTPEKKNTQREASDQKLH